MKRLHQRNKNNYRFTKSLSIRFLPIVRRFIMCLLLLLLSNQNANCYSFFTHETVIDSTWDNIASLLSEKFDDLSAQELATARLFAYGGCLIQDIGYLPVVSNQRFSELLHYVKTGEFITSLFEESQNVYEYAFAIGALEHYIGDNIGHSQGTNLAVPIYRPDLRNRYGNEVTYAMNRWAHSEAELGFDVYELATNKYGTEDLKRLMAL